MSIAVSGCKLQTVLRSRDPRRPLVLEGIEVVENERALGPQVGDLSN